MANSSMLARPMNTAPAWRRRAATVESHGGRNPSRIREAQVVRRPATQMLSFMASGTPASGSDSPAETRRSTASASCRARSPVTSRKARRRASPSPIDSSDSRTTSTADRRRAPTSTAVSMTPAMLSFPSRRRGARPRSRGPAGERSRREPRRRGRPAARRRGREWRGRRPGPRRPPPGSAEAARCSPMTREIWPVQRGRSDSGRRRRASSATLRTTSGVTTAEEDDILKIVPARMSEHPRHRRSPGLARLLRRREVRAFARVARRQGADAWLVGGAVRDAWLGLPVPEVDAAIARDAEAAARALEAEGAGRAVFLSGIDPGPASIAWRAAGPSTSRRSRELRSKRTSRGATSPSTPSPSRSTGDRATSSIRSEGSATLRRSVCVRCAGRTSSTIRSVLCARPAFSRPTASTPTARHSPPPGPPPPASSASPPNGSRASSRGSSAARARPRPWAGRRKPASCRRPSDFLCPPGAPGPSPAPSPRSTTPGRAAFPSLAGGACDWPPWLSRSAFRGAEPPAGFPGEGCRGGRRTTRPRMASLVEGAASIRPGDRKGAWRWVLEAGPLALDAARLLSRRGETRLAARLARLARRKPRRVDVGGDDVLRWLGIPAGPAVGVLLRELAVAAACGQVRTRREARNWLSVQVREAPAPAIISEH